MSLILMIALAGTGSSDASLDGASFPSLNVATAEIVPAMQTGTLLVTEGDCLAVRIYTKSRFTHVAAVVVRNGSPLVYDAANGTGVRCQTLAGYLKTQSPNEIHILQPRKPLSERHCEKFEKYLDSQLGRSYSVRHHLTGERSDGVHCSEYVTNALISCGMLKAARPSRVSPASLVVGVTRHKLHLPIQSVRIEREIIVEEPADSWYGRLWQDTRRCTSDCCRQTMAWVLCRQ